MGIHLKLPKRFFFLIVIFFSFYFNLHKTFALLPSGAKLIPQIPFVMLDCYNGDWGNPSYYLRWLTNCPTPKPNNAQCESVSTGHPEWGAVGGWRNFGGPGCGGSYTPNAPGDYILNAQKFSVTLTNGEQIQKPVGIAFTAPSATDLTAAKIFISNLAALYNDNPIYPNLGMMIINCRAQRYGECANGDDLLVTKVLPIYRKYFNKLVTFVQCTQWFCGWIAQQYATDQYAYKNAGVKCNGWFMDEGNAVTWTNNVMDGGCMGFAELYNEKIPIGFEPKAGFSSCEAYWMLMEALSHHPDFLDIQPPNLDNMAKFDHDYEFPLINFAHNHLGKTVQNTPDVWTVLRENGTAVGSERCVPCSYGEAPDPSCPQEGKRCKQYRDCFFSGTNERCSGPWKGNFNYWLYPREDLVGSKPKVIIPSYDDSAPCSWKIAELPEPASSHPYSRYRIKRTDQASNNPNMSFDIDDRYVGLGKNGYEITATFVNKVSDPLSSDTLSLEYYNANGFTKNTISKGTDLGPINSWVDYTWRIEDANFANQFEGADFRLSSNNDGDEYINRVVVKKFSLEKVAGDINGDGIVNNADLKIFKQNFGLTNQDCDFNKTGEVDIQDFAILAKNYQTEPTPTLIPTLTPSPTSSIKPSTTPTPTSPVAAGCQAKNGICCRGFAPNCQTKLIDPYVDTSSGGCSATKTTDFMCCKSCLYGY